MHKCHAIIGQQLFDLSEIRLKLSNANVLEHANRNDPVELTLHFTVIHQLKSDTIIKATLLGLLTRQCQLLG